MSKAIKASRSLLVWTLFSLRRFRCSWEAHRYRCSTPCSRPFILVALVASVPR